MNEDKFNIELRKFLKKLGITSQREIEAAVREAVENGKLKGDESLAVKATVTIEAVGMETVVDGDIRLE
jgi:hypothetical protein